MEKPLQKFVLVDVGADRVALCRMVGEPFEAEDWKAARKQVPDDAFELRPGYGHQPKGRVFPGQTPNDCA